MSRSNYKAIDNHICLTLRQVPPWDEDDDLRELLDAAQEDWNARRAAEEVARQARRAEIDRQIKDLMEEIKTGRKPEPEQAVEPNNLKAPGENNARPIMRLSRSLSRNDLNQSRGDEGKPTEGLSELRRRCSFVADTTQYPV